MTIDEPPFDPDYDLPPPAEQRRLYQVHPDTTGSRPPQNLDAERALLTSLILQPHRVHDLALEVDPTDFWQPAHETIWTTALQLAADPGHDPAAPLDLVTLATHLRDDKSFQRCGGPSYLADLYTAPAVPANAPWYAKQIRDTARLRAIGQTALKLKQLADHGDPTNVDQVLDDAVQTLDDAAMRFGPRHTATTTSSWAALDLNPVLAGGEVDPPPTMLARTDGRFLLYDHAVHSISGEPTSGKTWFALLASVQQLEAGNTVTMLDFEDRASRVVGRLLALGAHPDHVRERFRYVRPHAALDQTGRTAVTPAITGSSLVIIDGVTEAMTLHGLDLNANGDVATFLELLPRWIADQGPAVLMIDHVVKDTEKQGRWSIGGQHKLAGIDGVSYNIKAIEQFGRGKVGHARITAGKDRAGHVEEYLLGRTAGELWLDATNELCLRAEIRPAQDAPKDEAGNMRPTVLMERVSRWLEGTPGASRTQIETGVSGKVTYVRRAIDRLVQEGHIEVSTGARNTQQHRVIHPFREDNDGQEYLT